MAAMTLSKKYQLVIPMAVRNAMQLRPGQRLEMMIHGGHITLVPVGPMLKLRGIAPGIDTRVPREADRV